MTRKCKALNLSKSAARRFGANEKIACIHIYWVLHMK